MTVRTSWSVSDCADDINTASVILLLFVVVIGALHRRHVHVYMYIPRDDGRA